jgi:CBS-domain-containing membrane protein
MQESVQSVLADMDAFEAVDLLVAKKLGFAGCPVVDAAGALIGFLTMKDCLRLQVMAHQYNMTGRTVRDIMSGINNSLSLDSDILSAATVFLNCNFLMLPVMDGAKLVGSVTRRDLVVAIQQWYRKRGDQIRGEKDDQILVDRPTSIEQLQALVGMSNNAQLASVLGGRHSDKRQ